MSQKLAISMVTHVTNALCGPKIINLTTGENRFIRLSEPEREEPMTPDEIAARMDGRIEAAGPDRAEAFLPSPVVHNHAAFLQWLPDGALACAWFAGTLEGKPDIFIRLATLAPGAEQWSAADQVSDDPTRSEQNPVIFADPESGTVSLFHTAQPGGRQEECEVPLPPARAHAGGYPLGSAFAPSACRSAASCAPRSWSATTARGCCRSSSARCWPAPAGPAATIPPRSRSAATAARAGPSSTCRSRPAACT